jgi:hypothetical protein
MTRKNSEEFDNFDRQRATWISVPRAAVSIDRPAWEAIDCCAGQSVSRELCQPPINH